MFIAILLPSFQGGGAERVMVTLANELSRRGHVIVLLVASSEGPNRKDLHKEVGVVDFHRAHMRNCVFKLTNWLRQHKPDALLTAGAHAGVVAVLAARLAGFDGRLIATQHGVASFLSKRKSLKARVLCVVLRRTFCSMDHIVAVSRGVSDDLTNNFGVPRAKVQVIYNPVDLERVCVASREIIDERSWPRDGEPIIITVGRLVEEKDHASLVRAFHLLRKSMMAKLVILGEGPLRGSLEELVDQLELRSDVILPGYVRNPFKMVAAADCFVLTSRWEGLPTALIETTILGVPIVCTDCPGGAREILDGVEGARLVGVADVEAIAHGMLQVLHNNAPIDRRQHSVQRFSIERAVNAYEELLGARSGSDVECVHHISTERVEHYIDD